jgi:hypothetical protein
MIAFTVCSNNYIAKAQVLASSIKNLSSAQVYLVVVDIANPDVNYSLLGFDRVIFSEDLLIRNLKWMKENYNVVELNTAIKPFAFRYFFDQFDSNYIYYFDPDIKVYQSLENFDQFWSTSSILLTPHILTPIPFDGNFPDENLFLNHGIYNLGFLALKRDGVSDKLISWWSERLYEKCKIDLNEGYFVDQLWFNLVPLLFGSTSIIKHYGCNMAYWNLHERELSLLDGRYIVNGNESLYFYHFSSFDTSLQQIHSSKKLRYTFDDNVALKLLYTDYANHVDKYNPSFYKKFKYFNGQYPSIPLKRAFLIRVIQNVKSLLNVG